MRFKPSGEVAFYAARDIAKGEECCISYAYDITDRAARQEHLRFNYGFGEDDDADPPP